MSRVLRFDRRYERAAERLGIVPGSKRGRAAAQTIVALLDAEALPGPGDVAAMIPPTATAFVRRVPGRNLWLWYRVEGDVVLVRHISSEPPVPLDE